MLVFCKKLVPNDTLVVNIEASIINPYNILRISKPLETTYTAGISKFFISTSTLTNIINTIKDKIIVIIVVIIEINFIFLLFSKYSFKVNITGISSMLL